MQNRNAEAPGELSDRLGFGSMRLSGPAIGGVKCLTNDQQANVDSIEDLTVV
jgi:hypothetical protein